MGEVQKQSVNTFAISIVGLFLGYINRSVLFPWILLPEQIGLIGLIVSCSTLFAQFSNLGISHSILKFYSYVPKKNRRSFFNFNLTIVLIGFLIISLITIFFNQEITAYYEKNSKLFTHYAFWVYILGFANLFFLFFEHYLKAIIKVTLPVIIQEFGLRLAATFTILIYYFGWVNFDTFMIIHLSVHCLPFLYLAIYSLNKKEIIGEHTHSKLPIRFKRTMRRYSLLTYLNSLGSTFIFSIDIIMLSSIIGLAASGVYNTVIFISSALLLPYRSIYRIASSLVPNLWKEKNHQELLKLYRKVTIVNTIIIFYLILIVTFGIDAFFMLLPKEYEEGKIIFFALIIGRAADAISGINGFILVTSKKYFVDIYFTVAMIITAILLNQLLIPHYGGLGAAIATSIVITLYNLSRIIYIYKEYKMQPFTKDIFKVIVVFIACFGIGYLIQFLILNSWVQTIINTLIITLIFWSFMYFLKIDEQLNKFIYKYISFIKTKH